MSRRKELRAKNEDELTDKERIKLEKLRERSRRYYQKKNNQNL